MTDTVTPRRRSEIMSNIRAKGMKPEMAVRRMVHAMGYRYRLHRRDLPGKPDLAFPARRKVIFVHGCFWHQHGDTACRIARRPKSNQDYWLPKLERTVARDSEHLVQLAELGWGCSRDLGVPSERESDCRPHPEVFGMCKPGSVGNRLERWNVE